MTDSSSNKERQKTENKLFALKKAFLLALVLATPVIASPQVRRFVFPVEFRSGIILEIARISSLINSPEVDSPINEPIIIEDTKRPIGADTIIIHSWKTDPVHSPSGVMIDDKFTPINRTAFVYFIKRPAGEQLSGPIGFWVRNKVIKPVEGTTQFYYFDDDSGERKYFRYDKSSIGTKFVLSQIVEDESTTATLKSMQNPD